MEVDVVVDVDAQVVAGARCCESPDVSVKSTSLWMLQSVKSTTELSTVLTTVVQWYSSTGHRDPGLGDVRGKPAAGTF